MNVSLAGVVGVTGGNAAGKGEVIRILQDLGFNTWSLSDLLREDLKESGVEPIRENLIRRGRELRAAEGPGVLALRILPRALDGTAVDSIRHPAEVAVLRRLPHFSLLAVQAPALLRFERMLSRGRGGDALSWASFEAQEARERGGQLEAQNVPACVAEADGVVHNDGTLENLRAQVEAFLRERGHRRE